MLGERRAPRIVFEHSGSDTMPTSAYVCDTGGMVVFCGATSGYLTDIDLRYLWMRQKRLQGSHGAAPRQAQAVIDLAGAGLFEPCVSMMLPLASVGEAHQLLSDNRHPPGNTVITVNAVA
ncbi:zinc-binding dehydrogenase [Kribbella sp. NPDC056861]|uniref:zinc-binding dehydrogenase n=1 Tax=Kribbella sp. NPDC056861 TaxID=3154857 RepID=UPI00341E9DD2